MTRPRSRLRTGVTVGVAVAIAAAMVGVLDTQAARADARTVALVSTGSTAQPATFAAAPSGTTGVFFTTEEPISGSDGDGALDVYRNDAGTVSLVTPGTSSVVVFHAASADGTAVVIGTTQSLAPGVDTDTSGDLYRVAGGAYTLLTGGTANTAAIFKAASPTLDKVVFETTEAIGGADADATNDVYTGSGSGAPTLVSSGALASAYVGGSADLATTYYNTDSAIAGGDTNGASDVYQGGTGLLISDGTGGGDSFAAVSTDGGRVFYTTEEDVATTPDADGTRDVVQYLGGARTLVSAGTQAVTFGGISADGTVAYYMTLESLAAADGDVTQDVYKANGATPTLMTSSSGDPLSIFNANLRHVSSDGSQIVFETQEAIPSTGDSDAALDLYRSTGPAAGDKTLLSGAGTSNVTWRRANATGSRVFFESPDSLLAADTDAGGDLYVNESAALTLVSTGSANVAASFSGATTDGARAYFTSTEQLAGGDTDSVSDVYQSATGVAPTPPTGPPPSSPPPDTTPPTGSGKAAAKQKNDGTVEVTVTCGAAEACLASASGKLTVPTVSARGKQAFTLTGGPLTIPAGASATLVLKVPKKGKKAAAAALTAGKKVKGSVTVVLKDAAGNATTLKALKVALKK